MECRSLNSLPVQAGSRGLTRRLGACYPSVTSRPQQAADQRANVVDDVAAALPRRAAIQTTGARVRLPELLLGLGAPVPPCSWARHGGSAPGVDPLLGTVFDPGRNRPGWDVLRW